MHLRRIALTVYQCKQCMGVLQRTDLIGVVKTQHEMPWSDDAPMAPSLVHDFSTQRTYEIYVKPHCTNGFVYFVLVRHTSTQAKQAGCVQRERCDCHRSI
jgi:hypothetical protein